MTRTDHRTGPSRRSLLVGGAGAALAAAAPAGPAQAEPSRDTETERAGARRNRVAPGVKVNVVDLDGGRRGTTVFNPGWPLASPTWERTSLYFADQGYRVVAVDPRGFGRSDAPYGPYGYDVWARDLQKVLEVLSISGATLVGHSMGGGVAVRHAAKYGNRIDRLVLAEVPVPRFVFGSSSPALSEAINGLIDGYSTDRAATVRALDTNCFATHRRRRPLPRVLRTPVPGPGFAPSEPSRPPRAARPRT